MTFLTASWRVHRIPSWRHHQGEIRRILAGLVQAREFSYRVVQLQDEGLVGFSSRTRTFFLVLAGKTWRRQTELLRSRSLFIPRTPHVTCYLPLKYLRHFTLSPSTSSLLTAKLLPLILPLIRPSPSKAAGAFTPATRGELVPGMETLVHAHSLSLLVTRALWGREVALRSIAGQSLFPTCVTDFFPQTLQTSPRLLFPVTITTSLIPATCAFLGLWYQCVCLMPVCRSTCVGVYSSHGSVCVYLQ